MTAKNQYDIDTLHMSQGVLGAVRVAAGDRPDASFLSTEAIYVAYRALSHWLYDGLTHGNDGQYPSLLWIDHQLTALGFQRMDCSGQEGIFFTRDQLAGAGRRVQEHLVELAQHHNGALPSNANGGFAAHDGQVNGGSRHED
jgi:hypothetical protein